jgi:large subunit ribosomal protein L23
MSKVSNQLNISKVILSKPRITEKATMLAGGAKPVYTLEVSPKANKTMVMEAIKVKYKVEPLKINIVNLPAKKVFVRGKRGTTNSVKKALIYLKSGDKIELI